MKLTERYFVLGLGLIGWLILSFWVIRAFQSVPYGTYTWDFNSYNELILEAILIVSCFVFFIVIYVKNIISDLRK